jgi:hypothetical protein
LEFYRGSQSHFVINADGHELGRSYALEFVIDPTLYRFWTLSQHRTSVPVEVRAYAFDGKLIASFQNIAMLVPFSWVEICITLL